MLKDIRELINDYLIDIEEIKNRKKNNIKMLKIYNNFNLELLIKYIENNTVSEKIKLFQEHQNIFRQIKNEINFEEYEIYII